jgi:serine/threonine protein kinase
VVKLLDFGVAKAQGRRTVTLVGTIKGKIAYLSPEQCTPNTTIDGRSDIFALGICLYEMLTLHQLFQRTGDLATMTAIVHEQVPPPSYFRPDVPPELDRIVMTALAKDRAQRFENADVMHSTVEDTAATLGISTSVTALARYMTSLFGNPPEPWLTLEPESASQVTVVAAPLAPMDLAVSVTKLTAPLSSRDSADLDERIAKVRNVRPSMPRVDDFDETTDVEGNPASSRPSIPLAAQHPGWDESISLEGMGQQTLLDATAPTGKVSFEDETELQMAEPAEPLAAELQTVRDVEPPRAARVVPVAIPTPPPLTLRTRPVPAAWNVPRLVIAGVLVVAIIVAILLLA